MTCFHVELRHYYVLDIFHNPIGRFMVIINIVILLVYNEVWGRRPGC